MTSETEKKLAADFSTVQISLANSQLTKLQEMADYLKISVSDLIELILSDALRSRDKAFEQDTEYVLTKNAELLRRLA